MDVPNNVSLFEFESCLFLTMVFQIRNSHIPQFEFWTIDATSYILFLLYVYYKEKENLKEKFKTITDVGSGAKHMQYKKNIQNWEKFNILIFLFFYFFLTFHASNLFFDSQRLETSYFSPLATGSDWTKPAIMNNMVMYRLISIFQIIKTSGLLLCWKKTW